ncbi:MAG: LysM peptidoglycan-binding domain-containing protein [Frankia sp.]
MTTTGVRVSGKAPVNRVADGGVRAEPAQGGSAQGGSARAEAASVSETAWERAWRSGHPVVLGGPPVRRDHPGAGVSRWPGRPTKANRARAGNPDEARAQAPVFRAGRPGARPALVARKATLRTAEPPLRLTRRGRIVVILLIAALLSMVISLAKVASSASSNPRPAPVHLVVPGETLWRIAQSAHPGGDPRAEVSKIMSFNHLSTATVVPGQAIRLP